MKRKVLIGLLSVIGCVAIAGSGFASWYFGVGQVSTDTKNIKTYVTDLASEIGTLVDDNKDQNLYVVLNQGGYNNASDNSKGISVVDLGTNNTVDISDSNLGTNLDYLSATYSISAENATKLVNAGIEEATFLAHLEISRDAYNYIDFATDYGKNNIDGWDDNTSNVFTNGGIYFFYTIKFTKDVAINHTFKFPTATSDDGVNKMFVYKDGQKPTTLDAYNSMKNALKDKDVLTTNYTLYLK